MKYKAKNTNYLFFNFPENQWNEQICKAQATQRKPTFEVIPYQHHPQMLRTHLGYIRIRIRAVEKKGEQLKAVVIQHLQASKSFCESQWAFFKWQFAVSSPGHCH